MYKLAQGLLRHKVGTVAVIAFAVFVFSGSEKQPDTAASDPWSGDATTQLASSAESGVASSVGAAFNTATDFVAEKALGKKASGTAQAGSDSASSLGDSASAFEDANGG
jgi:hypothetical protein